MASTFTPNLNLELQGVGDNPGTWGTVLNTMALAIIDSVLGGVQTIPLSNIPVAISTSQSQNNYIKLTGVLTGNVVVTFPAIGRNYYISNQTTGSFSVTLACAGGGTTIVIPQGTAGFYTLDAVNVVSTATSPVTGAPIVLKGSTSPTPTVEGTIEWDTDEDNIVVGNGSGQSIIYSGLPIYGQARFTYSSASVCVLRPYQGRYVTFPSGLRAPIPSAGISTTVNNCYLNGVSGQSLSASTRYYAYLWNQGSVAVPNYVIDWSTTGHTTDTNTGIEIKSGDATRVLVGMAYPTAGPAFQDSATARLVASWFNRRPTMLSNRFTTDRSTSATGYTEINSEIRCEFVSWGDALGVAYAGNASSNAGSISIFGGPSLDGASVGFPATKAYATTVGQTMGTAGVLTPSEGYHYVTYMGAVSSGTGVWDSTSQQSMMSGQLTI